MLVHVFRYTYVKLSLGQSFSVRDDFILPEDIWQCLETFLVVTTWEKGVLLASSS